MNEVQAQFVAATNAAALAQAKLRETEKEIVSVQKRLEKRQGEYARAKAALDAAAASLNTPPALAKK